MTFLQSFAILRDIILKVAGTVIGESRPHHYLRRMQPLWISGVTPNYVTNLINCDMFHQVFPFSISPLFQSFIAIVPMFFEMCC